MIERYTLPPFDQLWSDQAKWERVLQVELAVSDALADSGVIPVEAAAELRKRAQFDVDKIKEYEKITRHDVIAFLQSVGDSLGEYKRFLHIGLTSSDVIDTAQSIALTQAGEHIRNAIKKLRNALEEQAIIHQFTLLPGRTHGMHAEPITLGWKICGWIAELDRNLFRWENACTNIQIGKLSGAVGTYPNLTPEQEKFVCAKLGLIPEVIATQVIPRDRHAEFIYTIASIAAMCERIALEVRLLQHSEIGELYEPFMKGQRGSSAMPHKKNPVTAENISGLSRLLRNFVGTALENVPLWHERDISHSSSERIILPDATSLVYYVLDRTNWIVSNWTVNEEVMLQHIEDTQGMMFSGALLTALKIAGIEDNDIYKRVQSHALAAQVEAPTFQERVKADEDIVSALGEKIDEIFDLGQLLNRSSIPFDRVRIKIEQQ